MTLASRDLALIARRFLLPRSVVTLYGVFRFGAKISVPAEVDLSSNLRLGRGTTVSSFTKIKCSDGLLVTGVNCGFGTGALSTQGKEGLNLGTM